MVQVGKAFTTLRAVRTWSKRRWLPLSMMAVGVLLLSAVGGYYLYAAMARSQLGEMEYVVPPDTIAQPDSFASLYPGSLLPSLSWNDPRWSKVDEGSQTSLFEGFTSLDGNGLSEVADGLTAPTRIEIPAIGLASIVKELEIVNYGDDKGWETPKDVVGHIPVTPHPGEAGNGYYFGHLQSPVKGEGSIFRDLPRISDLLRQGQDVYVVLYNEEGTAYLYQVSGVTVIPQEQFSLLVSSEATITLVACVPEYVYDHRLLVTAKLVGVKG